MLIYITTSFEGIHQYPDAPEEVSFLRNPHRHTFHVKFHIEVFHNDRDIEFILFKRYIDSIVSDFELNNMSCEQIIDLLAEQVSDKYPNRKMIIDVSEDNENGAVKEFA